MLINIELEFKQLKNGKITLEFSADCGKFYTLDKLKPLTSLIGFESNNKDVIDLYNYLKSVA